MNQLKKDVKLRQSLKAELNPYSQKRILQNELKYEY